MDQGIKSFTIAYKNFGVQGENIGGLQWSCLIMLCETHIAR